MCLVTSTIRPPHSQIHQAIALFEPSLHKESFSSYYFRLTNEIQLIVRANFKQSLPNYCAFKNHFCDGSSKYDSRFQKYCALPSKLYSTRLPPFLYLCIRFCVLRNSVKFDHYITVRKEIKVS